MESDQTLFVPNTRLYQCHVSPPTLEAVEWGKPDTGVSN